MNELLPVELVFLGRPFDEQAVRHTLRHLAVRVGWQFVSQSQHRLVYATFDMTEQPQLSRVPPNAVVVPSSSRVGQHLRNARTLFPVVRRPDGQLVPFPHPPHNDASGRALVWLDGDVIAGAFACLNLWFEQRARPTADTGIRYASDWMARLELAEPLPLADQWLDMIYHSALRAGWPRTPRQRRCTVVLTHDVDYLPRPWSFGLPRALRAAYRQLILRARPGDTLRVLARYGRALRQAHPPYLEIPTIVARERACGARSSFQFVVHRGHRLDPHYAGTDHQSFSAIPPDWEICLHGSYCASRTPGQLATESASLRGLAGRPILGHRQHYLNFAPAGLFRAVAAAALRYDMSVGYNDRSGPRAGTYFPFKPCDPETNLPFEFWEIPFVLMDTTLATTYRLAPEQALAHAVTVLEPVVAAGGCVAIIWHQEQCGGLLDPGYEHVYVQLLDWLVARGVRLTTGASVLAELDTAWDATIGASTSEVS